MFERYADNTTIGMLWPDDPDFFATVHPHWHNFPVPDPMYNYLIGMLITIICCTAMAGNLLVIGLFSFAKQLRTPANVLIINLAISDFSFSLIVGFPLKTISAFNQRWAWACELYGFFGGVFGFASLATNMFIALDRYFVISQPIEAFSRMTYSRVIFMLVIIWIWALLWSMPPLLGIGRYIAEGFHTSCTFDYISTDLENMLFNAGMYIFGFSVPVLIIIFCYYQIVKTVRRNEIELMKMAQKLNAENPISMKSTDKKADIEAAKTSVILVLLFLLAWAPYAIVCLMTLLGKMENLTPFGAELPVMFAKSSAVYNPFVYAIRHPKFRKELEKRLPFLLCCCPPKEKVRVLFAFYAYPDLNSDVW
ncbi:RHO G-protein coupled receptor [Paragonimus heterotremus]|uniref:RHO G-protein coupled receptor n=1 Tax=Paragonimus heterotremus TaxID=100268 RepID=A0A8J4SVS1_9TREM|nr:RHO G-protein coupled receptor [Paragonimus heterotremus]